MPTVLSVVHNLIIGKTGGAIILCSNEICFYGDSTVTLSSAFIIFACLIFFYVCRMEPRAFCMQSNPPSYELYYSRILSLEVVLLCTNVIYNL